MSVRNITLKIIMGFLIFVGLMAPQSSFAYWGVGIDVNLGGPGYNHYYRYDEHPQWGWHIHYLPVGHTVIWVGGVQYHYYDGLYYQYVGAGDYVLVQPPIGAYVNVLPPAFQPVMINGRRYFTDNGIYYVRTMYHGYKVVRPPVVGIAPYAGAVWVPGHYGPGGYWKPGHWQAVN